MAREIKNYEYCTFNEIMERPVDIFYGDKTEIITMSFANLPNCVNSEQWNSFLKDTWDAYFPEMDNLLDFLRYTVYHTGFVGRFYKISCILSLDDVFPMLIHGRLPNPDVTFRTWCKLHEMARFILEGNCKNSALGTHLILDLHTSTNSACDKSEVKIKFLNVDDLPNEQERVLIYHITICYMDQDVSLSSLFYDKSNSDSFCDVDDNCKEISARPDYVEESKSMSSQSQSRSSSDIEHWNKYGARPKNKLYSTKQCINKSKKKKREIKDPVQEPAEACTTWTMVSRSNAENRSRLIATLDHLKRMFEGCIVSDADISTKSVENSNILPIIDDLCPPPYSETVDPNGIYSPLSDKENVCDPPSASKPPVSEQQQAPPPLLPSRSDSIFPAPFIPSEDRSLSKTDDTIFKNEQYCRGASKVSENKKKFHLADFILQREPTVSDERFSFTDSDLELSRNERRLDAAEEQIRALQKPYEELLEMFANAEYRQKFPVTDPDNNHKQPVSDAPQIDSSSLEMPHINFESEDMKQKDLATDDSQNVNLDVNLDEHSLKVRGNILRNIIKNFFEDYKFPDAPCEEDSVCASRTATDNSAKEHRNTLPSTDFQLNPVSFSEQENSSKNDATSAACDQKVSSDPVQNYAYSATGKFVDKRKCKWEDILDRSKDRSDHVGLWEIPAEETPENYKLPIKDREPMTSETNEPSLDKFLEEVKQNIIENPLFQDVSPQKSEHLQSSTCKSHSTPPKKSEVSQLACSEDDRCKRLSEEVNETLSGLSEESLDLSDFSSSDFDNEHSSEVEL